ncbi:hypothetical protein Tco_0941341 [Tanacetum coccineum]|uniref:Uncharacterized protein n=1 Tax=Tanacetum coccineum TaxID=301880 RepID=A0ABQ5DT65_9ASTR
MVYKEAAWIFGGFPWVYVMKIKNEVAEVWLDFPTHLAPSFSLRAPVATFNAPMGGDPLPLDLSSMGKGQVVDSLDPMEQNFLFDTNDNSLGGFANMFEDETDNSQAIHSLLSGSWSALM